LAEPKQDGDSAIPIAAQVKRSIVHRYSFPLQDHTIDRANGVHDPKTRKAVGTLVSIDDHNGAIDIKRGVSSSVPHPAAIRMTRDRFGRLHRVRVFFGAGYPGYYPYDYGYDEVPYDETTQQSVLQQPTYVEQPAPAPSEDAVSAPEAPVPDVGQFVLVRKDGQVVLAAAFTISGDRLTYITPEGARHSFLVAELNKENTRQMNDSNGTTVTLPD
jgi:hypothetical protein